MTRTYKSIAAAVTPAELLAFLKILADTDPAFASSRGQHGVIPGGTRQEAINQAARKGGLAIYDQKNPTGLFRWRLTDAGRTAVHAPKVSP